MGFILRFTHFTLYFQKHSFCLRVLGTHCQNQDVTCKGYNSHWKTGGMQTLSLRVGLYTYSTIQHFLSIIIVIIFSVLTIIAVIIHLFPEDIF